ncbi:MAG TPA: CopG family transcriptional regulator [Actinomycetota bacterium]
MAMRKTTIYLSEEEAEALRKEAAERGVSQAELIRQGLREVVDIPKPKKRVFHSMGKGRGPGGPTPTRWDADELYERVMGRRR